MNFPQHIKGAMVAGIAVGSLAIISGQADVSAASLEAFVREPQADTEFRRFLGIVFLSWFMALFPDLDTGSTPRKHYFRWVFALLVLLFILRDLQLMGILAIAAVAPMLHKHRGWTHWYVTPWLLAFGMAILIEYLSVREASWLTILLFGGFSFGNVFDWLTTNWIYTAAFVIGHYTHLMLDSEWIKGVPIIGASKQPRKKPGSKSGAAKKKSRKKSGR